MYIDPTSTAVSKNEAQEILGVDDARYHDLKNTGLLQVSVRNLNRSSDAFACHSFYDLLYCALVPQLIHWLQDINFEDFEELVDVASSLKCKSENDVFPEYQQHREELGLTELTHEQLDPQSLAIVTEIMRVWDIIGEQMAKLMSGDTEYSPPALEDTLYLLTSKLPNARFLGRALF